MSSPVGKYIKHTPSIKDLWFVLVFGILLRKGVSGSIWINSMKPSVYGYLGFKSKDITGITDPLKFKKVSEVKTLQITTGRKVRK